MESEKFIYKEYKPCIQLQDYIDCYWFFSHNERSTQLYSILPDSCFDIVMSIDDGELQSSRVTGIWETKFDISYERPIKLIGVRFKLGALYKFLDYPIKNLLNNSTLIDIDDLDIPKLHIQEALQISYFQAFRVLEAHFINRLRNNISYRNVNILKYVSSLNGNEPIEEISTDIGISSRQLRRIFRNELGASPKKVLKLIRFKRFMKYSDYLLYYDQSHLYKDFKSLCNVNPNFLKNDKNVRILQYPNINMNYDQLCKKEN